MGIIISIIIGIGLSIASGLKVTLPFFIAALLANFNIIEVNGSFAWLADTTTLIALGVAVLIELLISFIPLIDTIMSYIGVPLSFVAGTILMGVAIGGEQTIPLWVINGLIGGGIAVIIKIIMSFLKTASTMITASVGNIAISLLEIFNSVLLAVLSFFAPILLAILLPFIIFGLYKLIKRMAKTKTISLNHLIS